MPKGEWLLLIVLLYVGNSSTVAVYSIAPRASSSTALQKLWAYREVIVYQLSLRS